MKRCWECNPHDRPTFKEILKVLDEISRSSFSQTPHESFHTLQDGWKKEIAEVLQELRKKEKVSGQYKLNWVSSWVALLKTHVLLDIT